MRKKRNFPVLSKLILQFAPERRESSSDLYMDISTHGKIEIQTLASLQHKSILPMNAIYRGRRQGSVYMITDLYDTTVDELIHNKDVLTIVNSIMICNCRKSSKPSAINF